MSTVLPQWPIRILIASATALAVIGWFGLRIFGVWADWMANYAAGHFVIGRQIANIYDFKSLQSWQTPLIGENGLVFRCAPRYKPPRLRHAVAGACLSNAILYYLWFAVIGAADILPISIALAWSSHASSSWSDLDHAAPRHIYIFHATGYLACAGIIYPMRLAVFHDIDQSGIITWWNDWFF